MLSLAGSSVDRYGLDQTGKVVYKFDSYGFREGNQYSNKPSVIFFGCSYLAGIGVTVNERFSNYFNSWNFGLYGSYTEEELLINYDLLKKNYKDSGCFPVTGRDPQEALNQISALSIILWHSEKN